MKNILLSLLLLPLAITAAAQQSWTADNGNGSYTNPLFYDEFSDPDVIRVGNDYYLAGTTMHCVPGVVILHSRDLVNWEFQSYCMERFNLGDSFKLKNGKEAYGQGIWAPCIRYHKGKFYVFTNINGIGMQVFVSENAAGPWKHINMGGNIYDLSVHFDDDGKIYAVYRYGAVHMVEIKPDFSGYVEGSDREIITEDQAMGEGHHLYKIDGKYYILSADYAPMGRMQCARADKIEGPYETVVVSARSSMGTAVGTLADNVGIGSPVPADGFDFHILPPANDRLGCATVHQGGIVQTPQGEWWGITMLDFRAVGRSVCLSPITWKNGWPYFGVEGNLGHTPRTWFKPHTVVREQPHAPYERNGFSRNGRTLNPVWQWNHEPEPGFWQLRSNQLLLNSQPAESFLWARNTLTQRCIGPVSTATVRVDVRRLQEGDAAGLGLLNMPYAWLGVVREQGKMLLRWKKQQGNCRQDVTTLPGNSVWLRVWGDYDNNVALFSYSLDGNSFVNVADSVALPYQLKTFQGSRYALFCFNGKLRTGGTATFADFTVVEHMADRTANVPVGKVVTLTNPANGQRVLALRHGLVHTAYPGTEEFKGIDCRFRVLDRGQGRVVLQALNGMGYVTVVGEGLSGDVRLVKDESEAALLMWQDMLRGECMLMSLKTHRYIGIEPATGEPYSANWPDTTPNRKNGTVFRVEVVNE